MELQQEILHEALHGNSYSHYETHDDFNILETSGFYIRFPFMLA